MHKCIDGDLADPEEDAEDSAVSWGATETEKDKQKKQKEVKSHSAADFRNQNKQL